MDLTYKFLNSQKRSKTSSVLVTTDTINLCWSLIKASSCLYDFQDFPPKKVTNVIYVCCRNVGK